MKVDPQLVFKIKTSYSTESLQELVNLKYDSNLIQDIILDDRFFRRPDNMSFKIHSQLIDKILGFKILNVERKLVQRYKVFYRSHDDGEKEHYKDTEAWIGLHPQTLLTPYSEILLMLELIKHRRIKSITDFGCAYGRIGFVMQSIFPESIFHGYEIVHERAKEAKRVAKLVGLSKFSIHEENILDDDFILPESDLFFIYDFSRVADLRKILNKLSDRSFIHSFVLIARGDEVRSLIQLYYPIFQVKETPIHKRDWSIFFT